MTTTIDIIDYPSPASPDKFLGHPVHITGDSTPIRKVWEPWSLRCQTSLDDAGQDCFACFLAKGTTVYYSEPQIWTGSSLTVWVQPGEQNKATVAPTFTFRIYGQTELDTYGAVTVFSKTWTATTAGSIPSAAMFSTANGAFTTLPDPRNAAPTMFDFWVKNDATDTGVLIPWTVRVVGVR